MKTLSISVAAYNMEKLIRQNLESFVNSPVASDIEVLVINDGSKDSTAEIVKEYEEKYPDTVKLITQANAGPGSTVNRGIENATGKYFRMVDADDWVDAGFEEYVNALKNTNADMVITNYTCVDDKTNDQLFCKIQGIDAGVECDFDSVCEGLFLEMHSVTWRTDILKDNGIRVFNGFYTDMQYLLFPAPFVKTALYVDTNVYMYRVSLTGQSMAAPSMQRNIAMHDSMLFSIVELYNRTKASRPSVAKYILKKLVMISGTQLGTLLSFEASKERKADLYEYIDKLRKECPDAYNEFKNFKTAKILSVANGLLYPIANKLHRKRLGL